MNFSLQVAGYLDRTSIESNSDHRTMEELSMGETEVEHCGTRTCSAARNAQSPSMLFSL
jgi:hypothetical protein